MIVLIDDQRSFKDEVMRTNDVLVIRTIHEAMKWLESVNEKTVIHQLWLDDRLGIINHKTTDIRPFIHELERRLVVRDRAPYVETVIVYTSNAEGLNWVTSVLGGRVGRIITVDADKYLEF